MSEGACRDLRVMPEISLITLYLIFFETGSLIQTQVLMIRLS